MLSHTVRVFVRRSSWKNGVPHWSGGYEIRQAKLRHRLRWRRNLQPGWRVRRRSRRRSNRRRTALSKRRRRRALPHSSSANVRSGPSCFRSSSRAATALARFPRAGLTHSPRRLRCAPPPFYTRRALPSLKPYPPSTHPRGVAVPHSYLWMHRLDVPSRRTRRRRSPWHPSCACFVVRSLLCPLNARIFAAGPPSRCLYM